jgi:quercetin dioxygenase-like cupin family protein
VAVLSREEIEKNPIGTELIFEDDRVRVWRIELAPGEEAAFHTHELDYTTVVVDGEVVERPNGDGTVDRIELQAGAIMRWYQGTQRHGLKNVGARPFRNVIVEIKGLPANFEAAGSSPQDATSDPPS